MLAARSQVACRLMVASIAKTRRPFAWLTAGTRAAFARKASISREEERSAGRLFLGIGYSPLTRRAHCPAAAPAPLKGRGGLYHFCGGMNLVRHGYGLGSALGAEMAFIQAMEAGSAHFWPPAARAISLPLLSINTVSGNSLATKPCWVLRSASI